jgi:hypothetical protein
VGGQISDGDRPSYADAKRAVERAMIDQHRQVPSYADMPRVDQTTPRTVTVPVSAFINEADDDTVAMIADNESWRDVETDPDAQPCPVLDLDAYRRDKAIAAYAEATGLSADNLVANASPEAIDRVLIDRGMIPPPVDGVQTGGIAPPQLEPPNPPAAWSDVWVDR